MWVVVKNYGPFLGTLNNRCRIIIGTQKGTIILTTTHVAASRKLFWFPAAMSKRKLTALQEELALPLPGDFDAWQKVFERA